MNTSTCKALASKLILLLSLLFVFAPTVPAQTAAAVKNDPAATWTSPKAEHLYGFPEIKPGKDSIFS
jgi:hypothetical protein